MKSGKGEDGRRERQRKKKGEGGGRRGGGEGGGGGGGTEKIWNLVNLFLKSFIYVKNHLNYFIFDFLFAFCLIFLINNQ